MQPQDQGKIAKTKPEDSTDKGVSRRKFPRRAMGRPAGILIHGNYLIREMFDVSEGGFLLDLSETPNSGAEGVITFYLPQKNFVVSQVHYSEQIVRNGKSYSLFLFMNLAPKYRRMIREFVAEIVTA